MVHGGKPVFARHTTLVLHKMHQTQTPRIWLWNLALIGRLLKRVTRVKYTSSTHEPTWNSADGANASPSVNQNSTSFSNATATSSAVHAAASLFSDRADSLKSRIRLSLVFTPIKTMVTDVVIQENFIRVQSSTSKTVAQVVSGCNFKCFGRSTCWCSDTAFYDHWIDFRVLIVQHCYRIYQRASRIAASAASSASADAFSTSINSTDSASPSSQRLGRDNRRWVASHVGTEPYTWISKPKREIILSVVIINTWVYRRVTAFFFFFVWIMLYSCKLKYNFRIYDFMDSYCYRVLPLGSTIFFKIIYYFFLVIIRLRVRTATINHTSTPGRRTGARDVVQIPKTGLEMHLRLVH